MRQKAILGLLLAIVPLAVLVAYRLAWSERSTAQPPTTRAVAVEVAPIEYGLIELRQTFAGTLEARRQFVVAANVGGRVDRLLVDLADPVDQGQVVAELDDDEQTQSVAEASAELAVARANLASAKSELELTIREFDRITSLNERGLVPDSDLDAAKSRHLAAVNDVKVAQAQLKQATAAHQRARIRSGYTKVIANWSGTDPTRVVAQRHVAEGDTVSPNDPLLTVVDLDPLIAVIHVTERQYGRLAPEQQASLTADAYPAKSFAGVIKRIAPVFRRTSRQARVEVEVRNPDAMLKPGMFVRVEIVVDRVDDATIVPLAALSTRNEMTGVFVVSTEGTSVRWRQVEVGIEQGQKVEIVGSRIEGRVVTIGQQLLEDGAAVTIPPRSNQRDRGGK